MDLRLFVCAYSKLQEIIPQSSTTSILTRNLIIFLLREVTYVLLLGRVTTGFRSRLTIAGDDIQENVVSNYERSQRSNPKLRFWTQSEERNDAHKPQVQPGLQEGWSIGPAHSWCVTCFLWTNFGDQGGCLDEGGPSFGAICGLWVDQGLTG